MTKKLRQFISVILVALSATTAFAALSACKDDEPPVTLDERPVIRVASDIFAPYFFVGEDGEFTGADVELAREAFSRLGYRAEFGTIDWTEKDIMLEAGEIDCLWGGFTMTNRKDLYAWAGPYLFSRHVAVVNAASEINSLAELNGKSVACQATSKSDELFSAADGSDNVPVVGRLYCFNTFDLAFAALRKGYADAAVGHETALVDYIGSLTGEYRVLPESLLEAELGVAFGKNNAALAARLTSTLEEIAKDGTTAKIVGRYGISAERVIVK